MRPTRLAASIGVLTLSATPVAALAQTPAPLDDKVITAATPTNEQKQQIEGYATYWTGRMGQTDPTAVEAGRDELIRPLVSARAVTPSATFRLEYSKWLVDGLKPIINGKNSHAAVNALRVIGYVGTDRALELAMNRADQVSEPRPEVRVWAAKAFVSALGTNNLAANSINNGARDLKRAAEMELNWLALRNQLAALAEVDRIAGGDANIQSTLDVRIEILNKAIDRMAAQPGPSDLIEAVYPAIFNLRNEYITLPLDRQRAAGAPLAAMLGRALKVALLHWDTAHANSDAATSYGGAIADAEELLRLIDKQVRAPDAKSCAPDAVKAWKDGNKTAVTDIVSCWTAILGQAPYKQGP